MSDRDKTISRALQNNYFIMFLRKFISPSVSWKDIAGKCIDQPNEYCLKLIKAKAWTDKTEEGGSWSEKLESFIKERLMLSFAHMTLWTKRNEENLSAVILQRDPRDVSPFTNKILMLIEENILKILSLYNISYRFLTPETLSSLSEDCYYIFHNRITWTRNTELIPFKRTCILYTVMDTPFTPQTAYVNNVDCINAGIMLWEYLIDDEFTFPNCVILNSHPEYIEPDYVYPEQETIDETPNVKNPFKVQWKEG